MLGTVAAEASRKSPMTSGPSAASFSFDDVWGGERRGGKRGRNTGRQDAVCGSNSPEQRKGIQSKIWMTVVDGSKPTSLLIGQNGILLVVAR